MRKNISRLANVIRKQYHGIVILAELEDKVVGYLLAWEEGPGSADPYRHKSHGPFLYVDEMAVLPEYQGFGIGRKLLDYAIKGAAVYNLPIVLVAALEALRFYEKLHFEPCGRTVKLVGDDKAQVGIHSLHPETLLTAGM
ncbi:hypothetical protein QFC20_004971 [Naganishia adeliensis]|uniref:Uncharacterized protein n=1 Tax=Naganishia adeliensis TaxID=92952 RepID=A0ACC2VTH0_9TREE|nr:hypothetical protein QFC20_004971 [Naganishia adeliensis]